MRDFPVTSLYFYHHHDYGNLFFVIFIIASPTCRAAWHTVCFHISNEHSCAEIKGATKSLSEVHLVLFLISELNNTKYKGWQVTEVYLTQ